MPLPSNPPELGLIERAGFDPDVPHVRSWIMFSPTELLRQYVKEAFAREGVAASNEHIRTWDEFRKEITRDYLGIVRTGTSTGAFLERAAEGRVFLPECGGAGAVN